VEGYEQVLCFVNGRALAPAAPAEGQNPALFVLAAADYEVNLHYITLIGINAGLPQSRELRFNVLD
jgi:hypothetical protein